MKAELTADPVTESKSHTHKRNTGPMMQSRRCGAKTRAGNPCQSPAVKGKKRCRMHGGTKGSGAPRGNKNALKHGYYTYEEKAWKRKISEFLRTQKDYLDIN